MTEAPAALVHRILAPSFVDGPGSRMTIFLQGCDLQCAHCHNPETWQACRACGQCVPVCPEGALALEGGAVRHAPDRCRGCDLCLGACPSHASPRCRPMGVEAILDQARAWAPYLDGVTFSGGECTLQRAFLLACVPRLQGELGLGVLLDTNGNLAPEALEELLPVADGFLFDVKALDPAVHQALTGAGNRRILDNLARAAAAGKVAEVRAVVIPGRTDAPETILALARLVAGLGGGVPLRLIPFRPLGVRGPLAALAPMAPAAFQALGALARDVLGDRLRLGA